MQARRAVIVLVGMGTGRAYRIDEPVDGGQQEKSPGQPQNRALPGEEIGHFRQDPEQSDPQQDPSAEGHQTAG